MDILQTVILSLTSDEVRRFKILSNRFKADDEKKLIILFDAIRSEKFENDDDLVKDLYEASNAKTKNRYYRLRNKLLDNIEKSLIFYHFKYKDSIHAYYDLQLSIIFRERGNYNLTHYFLKKSEKKARELDQFNILEQIYEEYVQLGMKNTTLDIEPILKRRKENLKRIRVNRKNTEAIALITQELKKSNFSRGKKSVLDLLDRTLKSLEESADIFQSAEGKILIFRTVSAQLLQKEAYGQLCTYLSKTIADFEENSLFNNNNHSTRLLMRLWYIYSLVKLYRFKEAQEQLTLFEKEREMFRKQNYLTYAFNYYNVKVNILKCIGKSEEAEEEIREALSINEVKNVPTNEVFLLISLADQQFNNGDFAGAIATTKKVRAHKSYSLLSSLHSMFFDVFALVLHFEEGDLTYYDKNIKAFRKTYKSILKRPVQDRTVRFLELLGRLYNAAIEDKRVSIKSAYKGFKDMFGDYEHGDNEIILYDTYLLSKRDERSYYELFSEKMDRAARKAST